MHDYSISPSGKIRYIEVDRGHNTPCWVWRLYLLPSGYGQLTVNGKSTRAHRYYWELRNGALPDGLEIDHLCRNRACVNPDHLEAVTRAENVRRSSSAKLTYRQVEEIRSLEGLLNGPEVGRMFGVTKQAVYRIWNGKRWSSSPQHTTKTGHKSSDHTIGCDMTTGENSKNPRKYRDSAIEVYREGDSAGTAK